MSERRLAWGLRAAVALPFVVALVALATTHWAPVLDLAMTELRVRDVGGRHTPLIGLPGRIGQFPDQGSHPGPLSFYLLTPIYRLAGSTSWSLELGAALVNVTAAWTAIWLARRRGGPRLVAGVAVLVATIAAWYGASVLTQPWNPYMPLLPFVVVLLAAWAALDGDALALIPLVVAATFCAQTHVPYLTLAVVMCGVGGFGVVAHARADPQPGARRVAVRSGAIAVGVGVLLWIPPLVDELRGRPGNVSMLREHFLDPPEDPVGIGTGLRTIVGHFDLWRLVTGVIARPSDELAVLDDLDRGSVWVGAVVVVAWTIAAAVAWRLPDRRIRRLHAVALIGTMVGVASAARIFGKVWYYLTLWAWSFALVAVAASVWTAVAVIEARRGRRDGNAHLRGDRWVLGAPWLAAVMVVPVALFVVDAVRVEPPEPRLSSVLERVVGPTADALADGVGAADGRDGTYPVVWADAYYFGSQGFGLISELERRGFDARAYDAFRVPVTRHRITDPARATAEVVLVTGVNIARWREEPGAVEVANVEPRSSAELAEYERLRAEAIERLGADGLDDVVALVETNLFGASLDPRISAATERRLARMLVLGQETSVFVAEPGTFG